MSLMDSFNMILAFSMRAALMLVTAIAVVKAEMAWRSKRFTIRILGFRVTGLELRVLRLRVKGCRFRVWVLGSRVHGSGFSV
jgi:hypothetical protein